MIESSICFLDSGIGGLPYLDWIARVRPGWPLSYVADTRHFPYGELPVEQVRAAVVDTSRLIFRSGTPRILVVACNTASVAALSDIRSFAPCPVVGTVPAVKPAATVGNGSPIGVLATEGTVNSPYLDGLVEDFAGNREVVRVAAGDIVRYVEERWLDEGSDGAAVVMNRAVNALKSRNVGSVVMGCTHFLHVTDVISGMMGDEVVLVDSRDGVGRRIISLLGDDSFAGMEEQRGSFHVTSSGPSDARYRRFAAVHGLDWSGVIL